MTRFKRPFLLCISILGLNGIVVAQTDGDNFALPTVIPAAPQSASLGKYGDIPVSYATGVPGISIPFFTVQSGKLSLPIGISYHASGIKVMDQASPTGLGWALNTGGDITRVVQGIADDRGTGFPSALSLDPKDPTFADKEQCLANAMINTASNGSSQGDGQPDLFFYSCGNKNGQFVYKNHYSVNASPGFMTMPFSPIQISLQNAGQTFVITDDDGTQYYFNRMDSTTSDTNLGSYSITTATSWHLIKILSAEKTDSIVLKYATISNFGYRTNPSSLLQENWQLNIPTFKNTTPSSTAINIEEYLVSEIDFNNGKVTMDYGNGYATTQTDILNAVHLYKLQDNTYTEIKRFTLSHSAFLNNSLTTNIDRLDSIQESGYYGGATVTIPPYRFTYYTSVGGQYQCPPFNSFSQDFWGYFNGKANTDLNMVGVGSSDTLIAPFPVSVAYKRNADSNYLKAGTLNTIQYPTGGTTTFDFEPNQITWIHPQTVTENYVFSLQPNYINTMTPTLSATFYDTLPYLSAVYATSGSKYTGVFVFNATVGCTSGSSNCVNNQPEAELDDLTAGTVISQLTIQNPTVAGVTDSIYFNPVYGHQYHIYLVGQPTLQNSSQNYEYNLHAWVTATEDSMVSRSFLDTAQLLTGGLRIRNISSTDNNGQTLIKHYNYTGTYFNSPTFTGNIDSLALYGPYIFDGYGFQNLAVKDLVRTYTTNLTLPIGAVTNNSVSYNEVQELEVDANGNPNGKTVYDYNQAQDYFYGKYPYLKVSFEPRRELLTQKRVYKYSNNNYSLLQSQVNTYSNLDSGAVNADTVIFFGAQMYLDNSIIATGSESVGTLTTSDGAAFGCLTCDSLYYNDPYFNIGQFEYTSDKYVLVSSIVTNYDSLGNSVAATTNYGYQNLLDAYPTHVNTTNSKGQIIDQYSKYVLDYPASPSCTNACFTNLAEALAQVKSNYNPALQLVYNDYLVNEITTPPVIIPAPPQTWADTMANIETRYLSLKQRLQASLDSVYQIYNGCINSYNNCVATYYTTAAPSQQAIINLQNTNKIQPILQKTRYVNDSLMSTIQTNYAPFGPNVDAPANIMASTLNNPLETRLVYNAYDTHGSIQTVQKASDAMHSFIWDYHAEIPIAEVTGTGLSDIAYTSFEADGSGNWSVPDTTRNRSIAMTGGKSYNLTSSNTISCSGLNSANTYVVSYWSANGALNVNGTTAIPGPAIGRWTYYEHTVTGASSISIQGTATIDELKLFPKGSLISTYTYDPLIGMTTHCDPSGHLTFYTYDGLGRLHLIKDQYGNILKRYDYEYQTANQ